jgi:hypothetical protein
MINKIFTKSTNKTESAPVVDQSVVMRGWKATNYDMTCRGFKYELDKVFVSDEKPNICNEGYHFCPTVTDVEKYYEIFDYDVRVFEVESHGDIDKHHIDTTKYCTNKIKFVKELTRAQIYAALDSKITYDADGNILTVERVKNDDTFNVSFSYVDGIVSTVQQTRCIKDKPKSEKTWIFVDGNLTEKHVLTHRYNNIVFGYDSSFKDIYGLDRYYENGEIVKDVVKGWTKGSRDASSLIEHNETVYTKNETRKTNFISNVVEVSRTEPTYTVRENIKTDTNKVLNRTVLSTNYMYHFNTTEIVRVSVNPTSKKKQDIERYIIIDPNKSINFVELDNMDRLDRNEIFKYVLENYFGIDFGLLKPDMSMNYANIIKKLGNTLDAINETNILENKEIEARLWALGYIEKFGFNIVSVTEKGKDVRTMIKTL